jgi:two-component system sensor histidine kinase TctE
MVDLTTIASAGANEWVLRALDARIDLGFALEHAMVLGDSLMLEELVDNLIDNALRYTPPGGRVTVATGSAGGAPYVSVVDSGPGIPIEERGKVLERFYRVRGSPGAGSGLGLAIVREIAERHGADISIDSCDGDAGTCVRIRFIRKEPAREAMA